MDGTSLTPEQEKLNALRQILPEAFSEGKIDWEKLKATLGENINFSNERYVLNWAGKSEAFKVLQTPTTKTLVPAKDESVNFDETENIFIEGENLEVMKVLQKSYFGKVKMIYIDPPYNTGNDSFIYPDKFSESKVDYEKRVGDKDEDGYMTKDGMFKKNSKENGQYHSNWLNMMMPRLYLAKNLLRQDGVIFVSIDDNEVHNLRLLMNEIFGEENFVSTFPWKKRTAKSDVPFGVSQDYEWILAFTKGEFGAGISVERKYYESEDFPDDRWRLSDITTQRSEEERPNCAFTMVDPKTNKKYFHNPKRVWGVSKDTFHSYYDKGKIVFPDDYDFLNISIPAYRVFESEDKAKALKKYGSENAKKAVSTFLPKEVGMSEDGNKEIVELFGQKLFSFPKPASLIKHFLNTHTDDDFIVLDFFAGSGTTAHAVMDLNKEDGGKRKYICIQLPELCEEKSEANKAGYKTIAEISKERIRRAGKKIKKEIQTEITNLELRITKLQGEFPTDETVAEIQNLKSKISNLQSQDLGFKVLKLEDSNFKQWQQIEGKDAKATRAELAEALQEQMKLFVDPVSETATIENMVYELLLKSGKDLNSKIEKKSSFFKINGTELILLLEKATQVIIDAVIAEKPIKVIALDKLFEGNDQLKTNTVLQMKDAGIEFKTI
jgi:adenine-specific DNA-methyltransferase